MVTLKSKFGIQALDGHGIFVADQPGLVLDGKPLYFYHFTYLPHDLAQARFEVARPRLSAAFEDYRALQGSQAKDLHLYYFDADGHGLLSLRHTLSEPLNIMVGDIMLNPVPVEHLSLERRFEAEGQTGRHSKTLTEKHDVYYTIEKFLSGFSWGWAGLFHNRDRQERERIFRDFNPVKSGLFTRTESLSHLTFRLRLSLEDSHQGLKPFREVRINLAEATLDEALSLP